MADIRVAECQEVKITIEWYCGECGKPQKEVRSYERPGDYDELVKKFVKNVADALKIHLTHELCCQHCTDKLMREDEKKKPKVK